jgi:glycosyltransferase involved in cell wall biosynthesis
LKIHFYSREYPAAGDRFDDGVLKAIHGLASGLVQNGAEVTVVCTGSADSVYETKQGYTIHCFRSSAATARLGLGIVPGLQEYIAENDGVYVINGVFNPTTYAVSKACLEHGRRYVCWPHEPHHPALFAQNRLVKRAFFRFRDRPMFRKAAAIQVFDATQVQLLRDLSVGTPTIEMLNGFGMEEVPPEANLEWRFEGPPRLLFFGSIDADHKGLDLLLDAFAAITNRTDSQLVLQGPDFGDLAMLKAQADRLGLGEKGRVEFREPVFGQSTQILAQHDVFVLPSRREAFSLAAVEAMLAARVLLVTERAGIAPHVLAAGCGVAVKPEQDSITSGLLELLDQRPHWKEMGLAGREYALKYFKWDDIAADLIGQYSRVVTPEFELNSSL